MVSNDEDIFILINARVDTMYTKNNKTIFVQINSTVSIMYDIFYKHFIYYRQVYKTLFV